METGLFQFRSPGNFQHLFFIACPRARLCHRPLPRYHRVSRRSCEVAGGVSLVADPRAEGSARCLSPSQLCRHLGGLRTLASMGMKLTGKKRMVSLWC